MKERCILRRENRSNKQRTEKGTTSLRKHEANKVTML
jgi:hypothetical protein